MNPGLLFLIFRILLLGTERISAKFLGRDADSEVATFLFFMVAFVVFIPCTLFFLPFSFPQGYLYLPVITGAIYSLAFIYFMKAMSTGEISQIGPLYNSNVLILLVFSVVFLHESLSIIKFSGILLMVIGAFSLSPKQSTKESRKIHLLQIPEARWMLFCSFLMALGRTIDGFCIKEVHPVHYCQIQYAMMTIFLGLNVLFKGKLNVAKELLLKRFKIILIAGISNSYSYVFLMFSFRFYPVSIAEPISMLSLLVSSLLAWKIFQEKIQERLPGTGLMIAGGWMIYQ